jgi:glycosyltransferase involved in cell wall biosynthesis
LGSWQRHRAAPPHDSCLLHRMPETRQRRVTMVTNAIMPDQLGGLQRYVAALAGAVALEGWEVTVLTKRVSASLPSTEILSDGVRLHRYDTPTRQSPTYVVGYPVSTFRATTGAALGSGLVHVHYPLQGFMPAMSGRRFIHTFHAPIYREVLAEHADRYALPAVLRRPLMRGARLGEAIVARRAQATVVLSEFMRHELSKLAPRAAEMAVRLPAGVDTRLFSPGPGIAAWDRRPLLFTARRLVPRTGVEELVRAMPAVLSKLPSAHLAIAGEGPLRHQIAEVAAELGCHSQVQLLGHVSDAELRDWYRTADLFVLPTQELEGFGMSTAEALACGTPALGTPVGATPELLQRIDPRLVSRSCSSEDLARAIVDVMTTDGLLEDLAQKARADAVGTASWSAVARRHVQIYERVWAEGN